MGLTYVTTQMQPLMKGKKVYEASFLVDTGAIDCLAPSAALSKVGIKVEGRDVYELVNGTTAEYDYGFARVRFMGSETVVKVVFGPEHIEPILGVVALESCGIGVDPVTKTLKRMTAKPMKKMLRDHG
jgi:clan AA aspartic protease